MPVLSGDARLNLDGKWLVRTNAGSASKVGDAPGSAQ
jgi:hypothetical protein